MKQRPTVSTARAQTSEEGFADREPPSPLSPGTPNDANQADSRGRTMVFKAAAKGNTEIVEWLTNQVRKARGVWWCLLFCWCSSQSSSTSTASPTPLVPYFARVHTNVSPSSARFHRYAHANPGRGRERFESCGHEPAARGGIPRAHGNGGVAVRPRRARRRRHQLRPDRASLRRCQRPRGLRPGSHGLWHGGGPARYSRRAARECALGGHLL